MFFLSRWKFGGIKFELTFGTIIGTSFMCVYILCTYLSIIYIYMFISCIYTRAHAFTLTAIRFSRRQKFRLLFAYSFYFFSPISSSETIQARNTRTRGGLCCITARPKILTTRYKAGLCLRMCVLRACVLACQFYTPNNSAAVTNRKL